MILATYFFVTRFTGLFIMQNESNIITGSYSIVIQGEMVNRMFDLDRRKKNTKATTTTNTVFNVQYSFYSLFIDTCESMCMLNIVYWNHHCKYI